MKNHFSRAALNHDLRLRGRPRAPVSDANTADEGGRPQAFESKDPASADALHQPCKAIHELLFFSYSLIVRMRRFFPKREQRRILESFWPRLSEVESHDRRGDCAEL
jgi:hypothetical protein